MKKRLEAELISIAHRILKLKGKSELEQLHLETRKLYETLSVLKFVEENLGIIQPKINVEEVEEKLEKAFDKKDKKSKSKEIPVLSDEVFDDVNQDTELELKEDFDQIIKDETLEEEVEAIIPEEQPEVIVPAFEIQKEEEAEQELEIENETKPTQISFEDLLGQNYSEPIFEKVSDKKEVSQFISEIKNLEIPEPIVEENEPVFEEKVSEKEVLIEKSASGISFGLNDRIGFEKQLFDGSSEDMNRVISQLSTFNSMQEAQDFIEDMVKPDYNNWKGKEDYEERFMEVVARKFE